MVENPKANVLSPMYCLKMYTKKKIGHFIITVISYSEMDYIYESLSNTAWEEEEEKKIPHIYFQ